MGMEAEQAIAVCNGQKCFRVVCSQRSDQGDAGPCPFIKARYGKDDLCRCCDTCRSVCRADIKDEHA
jgi:hypothetical protein